MITHVVFFKLKDEHKDEMAETAEMLRGLQESVPTVRELEVGADITRSERSYDLALIVRFDDVDGLNTYADHPNHLPVVDHMRSVCTSVVAVDFES